MSIAIKAPSQKVTDIAVIVGIAIAVIILYKLYKGTAAAVDAVEDVFGKGSTAKSASQALGAAKQKRFKSPFHPDYKLPTIKVTGANYVENVRNAAKLYKDLNMLPDAEVNKIVDHILDLTSFWNFEKSGTVFHDIWKKLANKKQVAQISKEFYKRTGKTILEWLDDNSTDAVSKGTPNSIIVEITGVTDKLPD